MKKLRRVDFPVIIKIIIKTNLIVKIIIKINVIIKIIIRINVIVAIIEISTNIRMRIKLQIDVHCTCPNIALN